MDLAEIKTLENLLNEIYTEIRIINSRGDIKSVPETSELIEILTKHFKLVPFSIPKLLKYLTDASWLFSFTIVEEDRKNKIKRVDAHIAADGPVLKALKTAYENELAVLFTREFTKKYSPENAVKEFIPMSQKFNNTKIGRIGSIAVMAGHYEIIFERNVLNYAKNVKEKKLAEIVKNAEPLNYFMPQEVTAKSKSESRTPESQKKVTDFMSFSGTNSIEKTIAAYGIEFYTRICFRDYNFAGLAKIIEAGHIPAKKDLETVKDMLQKIRANADTDLNLQNHAADINLLQKVINLKLKSADA